MSWLRKRSLMLLVALLLLATSLPISAAQRPTPPTADALVYYGGSLTATALVERLGIRPIVQYDAGALVQLTPGQRERLELLGATVQILSEKRRIGLGAGFDTRHGDGLPAHLKITPPKGEGTYLVQFVGPIKEEWLSKLQSLGVSTYGYVPNFAVLARMTPAERHAVAALPEVVWTGPFHPGYKLSPGLHDGEATVRFFPWATEQAQGIALPGVAIQGEVHPQQVHVVGDTQSLANLAQLDGVAWIEPRAAATVRSSAARRVTKADVPASHGVTGLNQIVAITDSGVYKAHEAFSAPGKVVGTIDLIGDGEAVGGDGVGHGTWVAGIALGDSPALGAYTGDDGHAYSAKLLDVKVMNNQGGIFPRVPTHYDVWKPAYEQGARINNNSWGEPARSSYDLGSLDADRISFEYKDYLLTIALPNVPDGPRSQTTGTPDAAKNVISVGSSMTTTPANVAATSGRGPTPDGRLKPDLVAPSRPTTAAARGGARMYVSGGGTSAAAPQVAAAAALVRQYFQDGYYPTGAAVADNARTPSAALIKAVLINGAVELTGDGADSNGEGKFPNNSQGWGRLNLERSLFFTGGTRKSTVWDEAAAPGTMQKWIRWFKLTEGSQEVKFTLVWTDPAAASGANPTLVNDLNLRITAPDGSVFLGNNFTGLNPGYSVTGGAFNNRDTVEGVHLVPHRSFAGNLPAGDYKVEVIGANVAQSGSKFALVVGHPAAPGTGEAPGDVAVMGDHEGQLTRLLSDQGISASAYSGDDYQSVLAQLDHHKAVVLNQVANAPGFDDLLAAAASKNKGLIFAGSYPVGPHGLGVLWSRKGDPALVGNYWGRGPVSIRVDTAHPLVAGYAVGTTVTLIDGGENDYQTYQSYNGTTVATSAMAHGYPDMIGYMDQAATGGARHVVLGSLGLSSYTHLGHWTEDGKKVFLNAVSWAAGTPGYTPPPPRATVALMGDHNDSIRSFLRTRGFAVDAYASDDYATLVSNLNRYQAVILHRVSNEAGFDTLLSNLGSTGVIFLSSWPVGDHSLGVLNSRKADPGNVGNYWGRGPVTIRIADTTHPVFGGFASSEITIINGGDNDFQTFSGFSGATIGATAYDVAHTGMAGVKDSTSAGGSRQVILGGLGASTYTHMAHWTAAGKQLLVNAIDWAKRPQVHS